MVHCRTDIFQEQETQAVFICLSLIIKFPIENTGRGQYISPEIIIQNLSANAVVLMIMMEDLSCLIKGFTHWIIWNIPAADKIIKAIPAGKLVSSLQGTIQGIGYGFHCYAGLKPF